MHGLAVLLLGVVPAVDSDFAATLQTEATRLQREVLGIGAIDADLKDSKDLIESFIGRSADAVKGQRYYLGLEELGKARVILEGLQSVRDNQESIAKGTPGFEGEWAKAAVALKNGDGKPAPADPPAAIVAIAQSAQGKANPLLEAARAWATESDARFGFYYLGSAKGAASFASFCSSLKIPQERAPLPLRSVLPELHQLQMKVVSAFKPPVSIERHSDFIRLNGVLKHAGELDAARLYAGALYTYLDTVQQYGAFATKAPDARQKAKLRKDVAALQGRLHRSERDESLAELFLQRAASQLAAKAPNESAWKNVWAIVDGVLPTYFAVLERAEGLEPKVTTDTTVTLIRWPYT